MSSSTIMPLAPAQIIAAGVERISKLTDQYGITSPEVFSACERWGSILDDVNHPDTTCKNCGDPVTYVADNAFYVHRGYDRHCRRVAASVATPKEA